MPEIQELTQRIEKLERILSTFVFSDRFVLQRDIQMLDGRNFQFSTATGTKIGTATGQKIGFFNVTPVVQQAALTAADNGTVDTTYGTDERDVITNIRTRVGEIATRLQNLGLIA